MSQPISVLLIDDNPTFLRIITRYLEDRDDLKVVGIARGGEEGLAQARKLLPDVILLDLVMDEMSGLQILPYLKETNPDFIIIVLTMHDTEAYKTAVFDAGGDGFVPKASLGSDLLPTIERLCNEEIEVGG